MSGDVVWIRTSGAWIGPTAEGETANATPTEMANVIPTEMANATRSKWKYETD